MASFLNITGALNHVGISISGLDLLGGFKDGIKQDRLFFNLDSAETLKLLIEATGKFTTNKPNADHPGMNDWGFRQDVLRAALQIGGGSGDKEHPGGAFVDLDFWNPLDGVVGLIGHGLEYLGNRILDRKTDPFAMGRRLGSSITNYTCSK